MFFLVVGQLTLSTKTNVATFLVLDVLLRCFEIARHLSFSVGLPRSACPIVSIVSVFIIKILAEILASHILILINK